MPVERRRCWAWVGSDMTWIAEKENGERWEVDPVTRWMVQPIDDQAEVVEIPDAVWLKRCNEDLRSLAEAALILAAAYEATSMDVATPDKVAEAIAVAQELAPRYTTEAGQ